MVIIFTQCDNSNCSFLKFFCNLWHWYPQVVKQYLMCGNSSELYSIIFIRWGKVCLSLFNIRIILEHLLATFSECFFQVTCVSRVSPRKFNSSTFSMIVLHIFGLSVFFFFFHVEQHKFSFSYIK